MGGAMVRQTRESKMQKPADNSHITLFNKKQSYGRSRDRATRCVSKFVLCFTIYGSYKGFKQ